MKRHEWTRDQEDTLVRLWADDNLSATAIGLRMGISKNAVLGKVHRLKLPARTVGFKSGVRRGW